MLSRALSLATVILLTGLATVPSITPASAQNLEAGKAPSQIFAGGCAVCHKSPRGLLKTVAPGALPGFLRQHYTTSTDMAATMSAYVISNGAADRRPAGDTLTRQGRELSIERKPDAVDGRPGTQPSEGGPQGRRQRPVAVERQESARPNADGLPAQAEPGPRSRRNARRLQRENPEAVRPDAVRPEATAPDTAKPSDTAKPLAAAAPVEAERPASLKRKLGKKGRQREEQPKSAPVNDEPKVEPKSEPVPESVKREPEPPKAEPVKPPAPKPAEDSKPEAPPLRADPVPDVTPAPSPAPSAAPKAPDSEPRPVAPPDPAPAAPPAPAATPNPQ